MTTSYLFIPTLHLTLTHFHETSTSVYKMDGTDSIQKNSLPFSLPYVLTRNGSITYACST